MQAPGDPSDDLGRRVESERWLGSAVIWSNGRCAKRALLCPAAQKPQQSLGTVLQSSLKEEIKLLNVVSHSELQQRVAMCNVVKRD